MVADDEKVRQLKKELRGLSQKDEIATLKKKIKAKKKEGLSKVKKAVKKATAPRSTEDIIASLPQ